MRHADLELAGAVANVLDVELNDIFTVETTPVVEDVEDDVFDPDQSRGCVTSTIGKGSDRSRTTSRRSSMALSPHTGIGCTSDACANSRSGVVSPWSKPSERPSRQRAPRNVADPRTPG